MHPRFDARPNGSAWSGHKSQNAVWLSASQGHDAAGGSARVEVRFGGPPPRIPTMAVTIRVPTTLRTLTAGESEVQVEPGTVQAVLGALEAAHPGFAERLLDEDGNLRRFVNVFVSDDDVRFMDGLETAVPDGETLSIVPAVAGGA